MKNGPLKWIQYLNPWSKMLLIIGCLSAALSPLAQPQTTPTPNTQFSTLKYGCIEFSPYCYVDAQGQAQGTFVELASRISQQAGYQIKTLVLPPKRAIRMVKNGKLDLWIGLDTIASYRDAVYRSDQPVAHFLLDIYSLTAFTDFPGLSALHNKRVAVIRGYTYGGLYDKLIKPELNITLLEVADHVQATNALYRRNIDFMIGYRAGVTEAAKQLGKPHPRQYPISKLNVYIMVPKRIPNASLVLKQLEAAYQTLTQTHSITVQSPSLPDDTVGN